MKKYRRRRFVIVMLILVGVIFWLTFNPESYSVEYYLSDYKKETNVNQSDSNFEEGTISAIKILKKIDKKERDSKKGYSREEFYSSWPIIDGCSLRQRIIKREMGDTAKLADNNCDVISGEYDEPYTGSHLVFYQKSDFSNGVQIDHVVALSDAWQKGAQNLSKEERYNLATDPLNLLAVDASTNMGKSDGDASNWLPENKTFRCQYVARQISVKYKYHLWMSNQEYDVIENTLKNCPKEPAIGIEI